MTNSSISHRRIPAVHKIVVLRANAIGDFVFALPALAALREAYPDAEIALLATQWHKIFLDGRPSPVDRVIVVPPTRGVSLPSDVEGDPTQGEAFFLEMQRERFDVAIQLHGGGRHSNPFIRRLSARTTIGLRAADAEPLDRWVPYVYYQPEVLRYLEVVSLVGAKTADLEPRIAVTERDRAEADSVLPSDGRPLVVMHAGAGDPRRRWPAENFARAGDALANTGARIAITGATGDRHTVERIRQAMQTEGADLCGRLSLGGLAGLLARAAVVVGNDSGPLHVAAAVGAPTVGLYWCGNLINAGPVSRTRHRPLVSWQLACSVCGRHVIHDPCDHRPSFVSEIQVEEVIAFAQELLEAAGPDACEKVADAGRWAAEASE